MQRNATAKPMAELKNHRHEQFCQLVALGQPLYKAYGQAYGRKDSGAALRSNAARLWTHLNASPKIRKRVNELMKKKRRACELTLQRCLDDMLDTADLARAAGQYGASITAQKALAGGYVVIAREKAVPPNPHFPLIF